MGPARDSLAGLATGTRARARARQVPRRRGQAEELADLHRDPLSRSAKEAIIEKIVEVVNDDGISGISTSRDFSDRDGIRLAIELKKG
jgi:hypothetical protein